MTPVDVPGIALLLLKLLVLMGLGVYCIFAVIMVRQEQLMANVIEESFEPVLKILTILHLGAAVAVTLLAILLL